MTEDRLSDAAVPATPSGQTRERPEYGEYATPEEQRARIRQPDLTYALDTGQDPDRVAARQAPARPSAAAAPIGAPPGQGARRRRVDLIVACVLLGYGLINVILTIVSMRDFAAFADQFFRTAGIEGEFTNIAAGAQWSAIASVVIAAGWLLTAVGVLLQARRRRRVWWIPVVGAAVSIALMMVCLMIPLMGDPAVMDYFSRAS